MIMCQPPTERRDAPETVPDTAAECRTMDEVRAAIDRIDREVVALLAERGGYVRQAGRIKDRRERIVGPPRIEDVVAKVRNHAQARGLAPDLVEAVYRVMIARFIDLETVEFDRLHGGGGG